MKFCTLLLLAGSVFFACTLAAQETTEASRGPDGGTRIHLSGIEILPLAGAPFSGRECEAASSVARLPFKASVRG